MEGPFTKKHEHFPLVAGHKGKRGASGSCFLGRRVEGHEWSFLSVLSTLEGPGFQSLLYPEEVEEPLILASYWLTIIQLVTFVCTDFVCM